MKKILWDKTIAWNSWFRDELTLPRLKRAGYSVIGLTVGGGNGGLEAAMQGLASVSETVERQPDEYRIVRSIADVDAAQQEGQLALELNFQGTDPLQGRLEAIEEFWKMGVRQMGLVWNSDNAAGSSVTSATDAGLTKFGRQLVARMNRVGMIVDGSHVGYRTTMDAMHASQAPLIFSHSNVYAIAPSYKNLKDDQIVACAQSGGVIGISGFGTYFDDLQVPAHAMFRQIDYVCELVGARHVGLGLDFVCNPLSLWEKVRTNPQLWPGVRESRFFPPEEVADLINLMVTAGYSDHDIADIQGRNWHRVSADIWGRRREGADGF